MREISIEKLDDINEVKEYLLFLSSVLQGWYLGADELFMEQLKVAFGVLSSETLKMSKKL